MIQLSKAKDMEYEITLKKKDLNNWHLIMSYTKMTNLSLKHFKR